MLRLPQLFIAAPLFTEGSDGARVLHYLCHSFNKMGVKSSLVFLDPRDPSNTSFVAATENQGTYKEYQTPVVKNLNEIDVENDVIIYPEIVQGNPLKGRNIVRYFLNKNGFITGIPVKINSGEFILSFQKIFEPNAHFNLYFTMQDEKLIPSREAINGLLKNISLTHIGKGSKYGNTERVGGTIGLDWSKSKEEYYILLESAKYLFTWDPLSGVVYDAILRGCIPVVISPKPWTYDQINSQELYKPYMTIEEFEFKHKFYENFDLFLNARDKMISDINQHNNEWESQLNSMYDMLLNFFIKE
jgi:hypothetical protein